MSLYQRALELFNGASYAEQREFARAVVDVFAREAIEVGRFEERIQGGLVYTPEYDRLLEEFQGGITGWDISVSDDTMMDRISIHIESKTIDTGIIDPDASQYPPTLCSEHRVNVGCYLEISITVAPMLVNDRVRASFVVYE